MRVQSVFFTLGAIFILFAVVYFTKEFLRDLPNTVKLVMLIVSLIVAFIIAEILRTDK